MRWRSRLVGLIGVATVAVTTLCVVGPPAAGQRAASQVWVDLGPGRAFGINDRGQVVGTDSAEGRSRAVMWEGGLTVYLGTLNNGLIDCVAGAINDSSQIVGNCSNPQGTVIHAFLWSSGRMKDLGTLGGPVSDATAINGDGEVVGLSNPSASAQPHAVLWANGTIHDLGTLGANYVGSLALGINGQGQVAGWSWGSTGRDQAFVWQHGVMSPLAAPSGSQSEAVAVNLNGEVVGGIRGRGATLPAMWSGGVLTMLPTLGGDGGALAINRLGTAVGWVEPSTGGAHAAIWSTGHLIDLGTVRNAPTIATAINNLGEVAGRAEVPRHSEAIALLNPGRLGTTRLPPSPAQGFVDGP
jgi:probable HAF family extracellular repeat protein